jgi:hypothetical protein
MFSSFYFLFFFSFFFSPWSHFYLLHYIFFLSGLDGQCSDSGWGDSFYHIDPSGPGPIQHPSHQVPDSVSLGIKRLTIQQHLMPKSRMFAALFPHLLYTFMVWYICTVQCYIQHTE